MEREKTMSNSSLATYRKISPNKNSPRNHKIDTITIHCMAGNLSVETCGALFANPARQASSNYGIGSDGRIALYVDEKDRSWCSSSPSNDHRAITIEVANDGGAPDWHVSDKALAALIKLVADICKRNNIKKLLWKNDKSLIGQVSKQNMTLHRWFAAKACPGEYLISKHPYIVKEVNAILAEGEKPKTTYYIQVGAFTRKANATRKANELQKHGFAAIVKKGSDKQWHVQAGAYTSKKNATALVERLKKAGITAIIKTSI